MAGKSGTRRQFIGMPSFISERNLYHGFTTALSSHGATRHLRLVVFPRSDRRIHRMGETGSSSTYQGNSEEVLDSLPLLHWQGREVRFRQGRRTYRAGGA